MKQLFISLFVLLANVGWAQASTVETTLWEETYTGEIVLNSETVATFKAGDVLRVYVTVPSDGANFKIFYKGESTKWAETAIPSIDNQWPWVNEGNTYADITLTDGDIAALAGNNIYISKGDNSTIDKVTLITTVPDEEPAATSTLWSGSNALGNWSNFEELRYDGKGELANVKVGDAIRVTFTDASEGWQIYVCDAASYGEFTGGYFDGAVQGGEQSVSFKVPDAVVLENIAQKGIVVKGKLATLTKIELLTYADSYDAVPLTIGSDEIATFGSSKNLDFSKLSGVTPYYASAVESGTVTLTPVETTRAWTGYIVKGAEGTYDIPVSATEPEWIDAFSNLRYTSDYDGNMVYRSAYSDYSGTDDNATKIKTYYRYIFAKDNSNNIGFYKLATDYSRSKGESTVYYYELGAHKAYLETSTDVTPTPALARVALLFSDDETTAVQTIEAIERPQSDKIYNISGQQVGKPTRGLYIINGKKVIIK